MYVFVPLLDYIIPIDNRNLSPEKVKMFEKDNRFLIPVYLNWITDVLALYIILYLISTETIATTTLSFVLYAYSYA